MAKYEWVCGGCGKQFSKNTPQGMAMAKANHLRKHYRQERGEG